MKPSEYAKIYSMNQRAVIISIRAFEYIKSLFSRVGVSVKAINESTKTKDKELIDDFVSIGTSFCNRIYGRVRKKKTIEIIEKIRDEDKKIKTLFFVCIKQRVPTYYYLYITYYKENWIESFPLQLM